MTTVWPDLLIAGHADLGPDHLAKLLENQDTSSVRWVSDHFTLAASLPKIGQTLNVPMVWVMAAPANHSAAVECEDLMRQVLNDRQWAHQILHPSNGEYFSAAQRAFNNGLTPAQTKRQWVCQDCSDPACEHRLFSDLLKKRDTNGVP